MRKPRSAKQKAARIQPKREASEARASRLARSQRIRPLTDLGNAERLVAAHGSDMLFAPFVDKHGKWFVWDGIRWRKDDRAQVRQFAKRVVRSIPQESKNAKVRKWAKNSEARAKLEAMILLAESEPGKIILPSEWDSDPFLLNVLSGTVDLRTQRLLPHNRDDLISKLAPVQFDPGAACPRWLRFLNQIMAGNADLIAFLRRIIATV
jgi:putative DNA primase/helicase